MEKKTQDLAWKCAPKEFRGIVRNMYERFCKPASLEYFEDARSLLKALYGHHNLTSDTEPEEMLHCSRDFVIGRYKHLTSSIAWNEGDVRAFQAETSLLKELFGDKCLPDKEAEQPEPKKFFESDYSIGDKVIVCISSIGEPRKEVVTLIRHYQPQCEYNDYAKTWLIQTQNGQTFQANEEYFEPCTEEKAPIVSKDDTKDDTKETMEEKELDFCELLKGCERMEVYSLLEGITFIRNVGNALITTTESNNYGEKGNVYAGGECLLYPSKELYEKYPLDAYSAWMEWKAERKPKRWRAKKYQGYYYIDIIGGRIVTKYDTDEREEPDNNKYDSYNYFRTEEEAKQAAEAVRETLAKFHERNTGE